MNTTDQILDSNLSTDTTGKTEIEIVDVTKFLILYVLSFGFYGIWWMYKSWRFFKEKESLDILPAARAIFGIFFLYSLLEKIQAFARSAGYNKTIPSGPLAFAFIIVSIISSRLPDPYWVIGYAASLLLMQPVNTLNFAIENSEAYSAWRGGFNNRQIGLLIAGSILWILVLIGLLVPAEQY
jgi:hypothetical protein